MATIKKYQFAVIATDVVIFTIQNNELKVLLIKMKKSPFTGRWAAPGGLVGPNESVDESAARHLVEKTGLKNVYMEQLYTFGKVNRDPFGRVVSVAYSALIPPDAKVKIFTTAEYQDIAWFPARHLPAIAYDHKEIISYAIERLKSKLEYTNIVYSLMPREFTLGELQDVYELILGRKLDKRNFRRKIASARMIRELAKKREGEANRPAALYIFTSHKPQKVEMI
ncbi:MAG: NUDIX hydrolase [Candidatus Spechtbacteria bacterium]|nr:NUDIX hydrolase [Candidatus Spechtbacteria bacterium]